MTEMSQRKKNRCEISHSPIIDIDRTAELQISATSWGRMVFVADRVCLLVRRGRRLRVVEGASQAKAAGGAAPPAQRLIQRNKVKHREVHERARCHIGRKVRVWIELLREAFGLKNVTFTLSVLTVASISSLARRQVLRFGGKNTF